jgi:hypothetical protein
MLYSVYPGKRPTAGKPFVYCAFFGHGTVGNSMLEQAGFLPLAPPARVAGMVMFRHHALPPCRICPSAVGLGIRSSWAPLGLFFFETNDLRHSFIPIVIALPCKYSNTPRTSDCCTSVKQMHTSASKCNLQFAVSVLGGAWRSLGRARRRFAVARPSQVARPSFRPRAQGRPQQK